MTSSSVNMAGFLGHLRVEHDLELKIAELVGERVHVVARDGVGDFIGFLDRVGRDRLERLDRVPFAAADRIAEAAHDLDEALKRHEGLPDFRSESESMIICIM